MCRKLICLIGLMAVFAWSANALAAATLVDDFDSYNNGQVDACTTNWRGMPGGFASAVIEADPANPANKVIRVSAATGDAQGAGTYGILSSSAQIANGITKTLFLRFQVSTSTTNQSFGLTNIDAPTAGGTGNWGDFCVQIGLISGNIGARDGGTMRTLTAVTPGTWYNLWVVVNHTANTFTVYMNSTSGAGATEADRMKSGTIDTFAFRTSNTEVLDRFLWRATPLTPNPQLWVDDISIMDGTDLTYPSPPPVFTANNLLVNGDFEAGGSGQFGTYPYPSSWAGWGLNGSQHSDIGYRKDLKGVVFWWNDTGLFQDFAAVADRAYTISADVITPSSAPIKVWTGQVSVEWYDETGGQIRSDIVGALTDTDPNNTWKTVKNTFFAPEGAKIGRVVLMISGSLASTGKAYFDNVVVKGLEPDYNNDNMVKLDDFATATATWMGTSEITDLTGDSFFGSEDLGCFVMNWLQPIPDYELVWSDEFDGNNLNLNNWERQILSGWDTGNAELEYYTDHTTNSWVENGTLIIEARVESYLGYNYTSARLRTKGKHDFTYGKIEARIKIPSTKGIWPAFWMMSTDSEYGGWPRSGEIDIMESINQAVKIYGTIHYGGTGTEHRSSGGFYTGVPDFSTDFHVYAIEWEPTRIRWYVDGNLYSTKTSWDSTGGPYPAPFDKRFYLMLNVAVGGNWPGPPDGTSVFPQQMVVDYVRVYKKAK